MSEAKKMKLVELHLGPIRTNCYLVIQMEKKEALIIDPGDGAATVAAKLTEEGVTPKAILLTHGHRDHIGAVPKNSGNIMVFRFMWVRRTRKCWGMRIKIFPPAFSESP